MTITSSISKSIADCTKFWQSGKLQSRALLILRLCQLVWSASIMGVITVFLIIVLCRTAGICSETFADITGNIAAAFFIISILFHTASFIIRFFFIEFAPQYLSRGDFVDHLKAKRLYIAIMLMNTKGRPVSQVIIGASMLCNEYEIAKMSCRPKILGGVRQSYRSRSTQPRKLS